MRRMCHVSASLESGVQVSVIRVRLLFVRACRSAARLRRYAAFSSPSRRFVVEHAALGRWRIRCASSSGLLHFAKHVFLRDQSLSATG